LLQGHTFDAVFFLSLFNVTVFEVSQEALVNLAEEQLNLQHTLFAFKRATAFAHDHIQLGCEMLPTHFCAGFCIYNPGEGICFVMVLVAMVIQHIVALAMQITLIIW
jgi:hypothetical protein